MRTTLATLTATAVIAAAAAVAAVTHAPGPRTAVTVQADAASGLPTGKRTHHPVQ
jgi:ABC-type transporter Mla subunit MlaD